MGKPLHPIFRPIAVAAVSAFGCLVASVCATDAVASELYSADVTLTSTTPSARRTAYSEALEVVLARVAEDSLSDERIDLLFPDPANFVVQFQPVDSETLRVSFDGNAIERALTGAGESFWGEDRPPTLIWLAVDSGGGQRELLASSDSTSEPLVTGDEQERNQILRERILDVAERRGIPVLFPLVDTEDQRKVNFADVWGGFDEPVIDASQRYAVDSILIGRVSGDRIENARWSHIFGDEAMTVVGPPELALRSVADRLASVFSIGGRDLLREVRLNVAGIDSMEAYGYLLTMLDGMNVVERHAIRSVNGDRIEFTVAAHGGAERLARALKVKGLVQEERRPSRSFNTDPGDGSVPARAPELPDALFFFLDL